MTSPTTQDKIEKMLTRRGLHVLGFAYQGWNDTTTIAVKRGDARHQVFELPDMYWSMNDKQIQPFIDDVAAKLAMTGPVDGRGN